MTTPRATLASNPDWTKAARDAVDQFVAGLQSGIDAADAETYNAAFAGDVMWAEIACDGPR